jgi:hypothetical protein
MLIVDCATELHVGRSARSGMNSRIASFQFSTNWE